MKRWGFAVLILTIAAVLRLWLLNKPDVTDDEKHYIIDAQRLANKDPYIALRYHPFRHPEPSIGHPFLYQAEQAVIFKTLGYSVYTSRLPNALSGIAIVAALFLFSKQLGGRVSALAAFLAAVLPMAVRYNRNAQLDSVFALWITLCALSIWKYLTENKKFWLVLSGIFAGMTISTKLNGIYIVPMIFLLLTFVKGEKFNLVLVRRVFIESLWVGAPACIIAFLLNDPLAYLDGIINPSFEAYSFFSKEFITQRIPFLFNPRSIFTFFKANFLLLSPFMLGVSIVAFNFLIFKARNMVSRFLILWIFPFLNLFIIHGFDIEGVYGWVPLISPLVLGVSYFVNNLDRKTANIVVLSVLVFMIPFVFLFGWRMRSLPYKNFPATNNRVITETFYQDVIKKVNEITPKGGRVFFLPQIYYPLYALRTDISWSYYGDLSTFDVYVVESENLLRDAANKIELVENKVSFQDDTLLDRKIYRRIN
jgi:4-amino-4-deoxy-L-arabinose transferase-like glycosyltransferase